jgi:hypothetical protein
LGQNREKAKGGRGENPTLPGHLAGVAARLHKVLGGVASHENGRFGPYFDWV